MYYMIPSLSDSLDKAKMNLSSRVNIISKVVYTHCAADFFRDNYTSRVIYAADYTCSLSYINFSFNYKLCC